MAHEKLFDESAYDYVIRGKRVPEIVHTLTIIRATRAQKNDQPAEAGIDRDESNTIIPEHSVRRKIFPWYK